MMKKIKLIVIITSSVLFVSCESNTYNELEVSTANPTYVANIKPIIAENCLSCHSVAGGQVPHLETYEELKDAVLTKPLIALIEAPSGQGMPKNGPRMSQNKIDMIKTWAANGFINE